MKNIHAVSFKSIEPKQMLELTKEIKESLATDSKVKQFTTADLWAIQRQGRTRVQRRFIC